jgi:hypothetical protein
MPKMRIKQQIIGKFILTMTLIGTWKLTAIDRVNKRNNTLNTPAVSMIVMRIF